MIELEIKDLGPDVIDFWLSRYPRRWGKDVPSLDLIGRMVRSRSPVYATRDEVAKILSWKRPGTGDKFRRLNKDPTVRHVTKLAFSRETDLETVGKLKRLAQMGVPMASALMRFVYPDLYGTVDWRNWYVLSQPKNISEEENQFFTKPPLHPLQNPFSSTEITPHHYVRYLKAIRELASIFPKRSDRARRSLVVRGLIEQYPSRTPAEIDMALFSYSWAYVKKIKPAEGP